MYLSKTNGLSFNCGGTLVNTRTVLTAAHCVRITTGDRKPDDIVLWLGRYNLINWNEVGAISASVDQIIIHPDYKRYSSESYDADMAVLIMQRPVTYTQYIRPICLWPERDDIKDIEGNSGSVVGWGDDGSGNLVSNIAKKVDLPVVNTITCV